MTFYRTKTVSCGDKGAKINDLIKRDSINLSGSHIRKSLLIPLILCSALTPAASDPDPGLDL